MPDFTPNFFIDNKGQTQTITGVKFYENYTH